MKPGFRFSSPSNHNLLYLLTAFCAITFLSSCADILDAQEDSSIRGRKPGITIKIPNISRSFSTRSDDPVKASDNEREINDLWLILYNSSASTIYNLLDKNSEISENSTSGYTEFNISDDGLPEGNYKIFILANVNDYLADEDKLKKGTKNIDEAAIRSLSLNFKDKSLEPGNLPMACLPENIRESENGDVIGEDGEISFSKGDSKEIFADLSFLCAKVRYTILFDNSATGFSNTFDSPIDLVTDPDNDFAPQAYNVSMVSSIVGANSSTYETCKIPLNRVSYPADESYPEYDPNTKKASENLSIVETWTNNNQRAWQGVVYLPENLETTTIDDYESGKATYLLFNAALSDAELKAYPLIINNGQGLKRGAFYDVKAKITSSGISDLQSVEHPEDFCDVTLNIYKFDDYYIDVNIYNYWEFVAGEGSLRISEGSTSFTADQPKMYGIKPEEMTCNKVRTKGFHFPMPHGQKNFYRQYEYIIDFEKLEDQYPYQYISDIKVVTNHDFFDSYLEWQFHDYYKVTLSLKKEAFNRFDYIVSQIKFEITIGKNLIEVVMDLYHTGFFNPVITTDLVPQNASSPSSSSGGYYYYEVIPVGENHWLDRNVAAKSNFMFGDNVNSIFGDENSRGLFYKPALDICPPGYSIPTPSQWEELAKSLKNGNINQNGNDINAVYLTPANSKIGNIFFPLGRYSTKTNSTPTILYETDPTDGEPSTGYYWCLDVNNQWKAVEIDADATINIPDGDYSNAKLNARCVAIPIN